MDIEHVNLENDLEDYDIPEYMEREDTLARRRSRRKPPSRYNLKLIILCLFVVVFLAEILIGTLVFDFSLVPLCALFLLEVLLGACLEQMIIEVWGVVAIIQLIAGFLTGKFVMILFCVFVFIATVAVLRILRDERIG